LRLRFGMEAVAHTDRTCIIVVEIHSAAGHILTGIIVDSVSEVVNIKASDIEDTPSFGASLNMEVILGMAKLGSGVKILLDIDHALNAEEMIDLGNVA
jgi:purine-binding chemotaxis protein CheW